MARLEHRSQLRLQANNRECGSQTPYPMWSQSPVLPDELESIGALHLYPNRSSSSAESNSDMLTRCRQRRGIWQVARSTGKMTNMNTTARS